MVKRLFDVVAAMLGLVATAPVLLVAALGIRWSSPGPILYRARRAGRSGRPFPMYKLRTMHLDAVGGRSRVTAVDDPRVFPLGRVLRRTKIDELPQLVNVLRGEMSIIGPRPEDPDIVAGHYGPDARATLGVRPGLASPGSLYHDTHGAGYLVGDDPERRYVESLLPRKLALDLVYVERASLWYDLRLILRTLGIIAGKVAGRRRFPDPPELRAAAPMGSGGRRTAAAITLLMVLAGTACVPRDGEGPDEALAPPAWPEDSTAPVLVGAGDIARCDSEADEATASLLDRIPGTVFTTGDNVYPDGTLDDYARCYEPSWGRHRERTRPVPGNHDYHTDGAAGYFAYFGPAAGEPGEGWYAYTLGAWQILALNSQLDLGPGSAQLAWVGEQLAGHPGRCTLAYWHAPLFSSGKTHGGSADLRALWDVLYAAGVEAVLNGHEHHYERFVPQTPDGHVDRVFGIRQFVVGTGGGSTYAFRRPLPTSEVRSNGSPGVLAFRLLPNGYEWRFVPAPGVAFSDAGVDICHDAPETHAPVGGAP